MVLGIYRQVRSEERSALAADLMVVDTCQCPTDKDIQILLKQKLDR